MFDYLNKKITRSITIAVISVLTITCTTVFFVYSYLNIRDYTKKTNHICDQISAYMELRLQSYEESTSFFINNNDFETLIKTNSPRVLNLFSQFIASNIGIQNVFIYTDDLSIVYNSNYRINKYISDKKQNRTTYPYWDVYGQNNEGEMLIYSYPIKFSDGENAATFAICISPELLSDNTANRYDTSMTQNTVSFIGVDETRYCSVNPDSNYYENAKNRYEFSRVTQDWFAGYFRVSNKSIAQSDLYLQTFVSFQSVAFNIFVMGMIILSVLTVFSVLAYIVIRHYSKYLVDSLSSVSKEIEDFSAKEL